jgi:hypothetical protein
VPVILTPLLGWERNVELGDGTIIPSWLGVSDTASVPERTEAFNNTALRMGEVADIIYPSDKRSNSKKFNEYVVNVQHMSPNGVASMVPYPRCFLASTFGGQADRLNYTLRTQKSIDKSSAPPDAQTGLGLGAKVLVLCIGGEVTNAVIIGGIREGDKHDKDDGHHLYFEFNGVQVAIQDNGNFVLQMNGPTKADGTPEKDGAKQSTFSFTDDGQCAIEVETGVHIGSAGSDEALVMGTTYRQQQKSMHQMLMNDLVNLSTQITALGGVMASVGGVLTAAGASMLVPIAGAVAAGPQVAAAGASLAATTTIFTSISALFTKMYAEINNFESQTDLYLSKKNSTD